MVENGVNSIFLLKLSYNITKKKSIATQDSLFLILLVSLIFLYDDVLIKIKQTPAQVELKKEEREENIKGAFFCQKPELVQDKKILLVDDVFTTGATLEEGSRVLKSAGAKEVWGMVIARGI